MRRSGLFYYIGTILILAALVALYFFATLDYLMFMILSVSAAGVGLIMIGIGSLHSVLEARDPPQKSETAD